MTQADRDRLLTLEKAKKKLITQREAAEELGLSIRQVKRLLYGHGGCRDPSAKPPMNRRLFYRASIVPHFDAYCNEYPIEARLQPASIPQATRRVALAGLGERSARTHHKDCGCDIMPRNAFSHRHMAGPVRLRTAQGARSVSPAMGMFVPDLMGLDQRERDYMKRVRSRAIAGALGLMWFPDLVAYGQTNTATVTGAVTDQTQAAVVHALLEIREVQTGVVRSVTSNESGQFNFNFLPTGTYDLKVEATGFQKLERTGLQLAAAQVLRLDLELQLGNVQEAVTVAGEEPILDLASSDQLRTISNREVHDLPQQNLDWTSLANLGTGIAVVVSGSGAVGSFAFNGLSPEAMGITVDGTNASSDPEEPAFGFYQQFNIINTVNTDAIGEVSIVRGIIPASVGGTLSGNVNIITKSGTNGFHGDVFEINDNNNYDARNQFLPARLRTTFNQYGGSLGGRIIRNKLFFFGSYEGVQYTSYQALSANVPTPYLVSISPAVYAPIFAVFPKVPQPPTNATALTALYSGAGSLTQKDGNTAERFDYYLSPTSQITFRYTRSTPSKNQPRVVSIDPRVTSGTDNMYNASYTHTGGSWTSSTRFGYNHLDLFRVDQGYSTDLAGVSFTGFSSSGAEYYRLQGGTYTWIQDFAKNRGRHTFEFGGVVQRQATNRLDLNTASFSYSSLSDFQANIPSTISLTFDVPYLTLHMYQFGGYILDNYRATSNLTLNMGIRYDYFTVPKEATGHLFNRGIDPARPQLGYGFGPYRPPDSIYDADYSNAQPRFGFAWSVGSTHKTVIRGGGGIFIGPRPMFAGAVTEMQSGPNVPFRANLSRPINLAAGLGYPIVHDNFIPTLTALQTSGVISSNIASNLVMDPNFPNPSSVQWMMGVERELPLGLALTVNYVGNRGLGLLMNESKNLPDRLTGIQPDPKFASFVFNTPVDRSTYNSLQVNLSRRFAHGLMVGMYFTHASNMSYGNSDVLGGLYPQDNNNLRAEHGPAPIELRDVFTGNFAYEPPFEKWLRRNGRASKILLSGWQISAIFSANDGFPITITNGNSSYPASRPDVVAGVNSLFSNYRSTLQYINPAAFVTVPIVAASGAQARPGTLGRNALFGPRRGELECGFSQVVRYHGKLAATLAR